MKRTGAVVFCLNLMNLDIVFSWVRNVCLPLSRLVWLFVLIESVNVMLMCVFHCQDQDKEQIITTV